MKTTPPPGAPPIVSTPIDCCFSKPHSNLRQLSKACALLAFLAILFLIPSLGFAQANLLSNPGLETGDTSGWADSTGGFGAVTGQAHSGTYAGRVAQYGNLRQTATGLLPNTTYTCTGWFKAGTAGQSVYLIVDNYGGASTSVGTSLATYTQLSRTFTTGTNTTARISAYQSGTSYGYCDDFSLPQVGASNLVVNPGLETGDTSGWNDSTGSFAAVTGQAHTGTYAGRVAQYGNLRQTVIGLLPNTAYTCTGWFKAGTAGQSIYLIVDNYGGASTSVGTGTTAYTQLSRTFTTGTNTSARISAYQSGTGNGYCDDLTLTGSTGGGGGGGGGTPVDALPATLPVTSFHLTARPWAALGIPTSSYLDRIQGECNYWIAHQNASGAIIDPITSSETEYCTAFYAYAVGTLLKSGRITTADPLFSSGTSAMTHAIGIMISSGEPNFFLPPLVGALNLYAPYVSAAQLTTWKSSTNPGLGQHFTSPYLGGNWATYWLKGEWLQALQSPPLLSVSLATADIESDWTTYQKTSINNTRWKLYHDNSSDPDTLSVEVVGRGNLLALDELGYNGASAAEMNSITEAGTQMSLLMQDPSGQNPANGRTDDHCWVDAGIQDTYEALAEKFKTSNPTLAGQYRHAAMLAFKNLDRWKRSDAGWAGSFYVTKNFFSPSLRVGYQNASQYATYNNSLSYHTAESYNTRVSAITEKPAPTEIGGYALNTDTNPLAANSFAAAFANAGGMSMEVDLRGDTVISHGGVWSALGVVRFGRPNWDTRLGPSDGVNTTTTSGEGAAVTGPGVSFAPTWVESGAWVRMASVPVRYSGTFTTTLATPVLTKCQVVWAPKSGQTGPTFTQNYILTPDGILCQTTRTTGTNTWGVTCPVLQNDGVITMTQSVSAANRIASVKYPAGTDTENFILLNTNGDAMVSETALRSSYGDLTPVRTTTADSTHSVFIYPQGSGDPTAATVRDSFVLTDVDHFSSSVGSVNGTLYVGRTSAGGTGSSIDLNGDGTADVTFSASCSFILQLSGGVVTGVETDSNVTATIQGQPYTVTAYTPILL